mmetsp:Transcript_9448/g.27599  ORF Transcript_9448/g.27599 Transcript_9448/m.27599 type:complete len:304 (+) Transcript_9448:244-1155(+)
MAARCGSSGGGMVMAQLGAACPLSRDTSPTGGLHAQGKRFRRGARGRPGPPTPHFAGGRGTSLRCDTARTTCGSPAQARVRRCGWHARRRGPASPRSPVLLNLSAGRAPSCQCQSCQPRGRRAAIVRPGRPGVRQRLGGQELVMIAAPRPHLSPKAVRPRPPHPQSRHPRPWPCRLRRRRVGSTAAARARARSSPRFSPAPPPPPPPRRPGARPPPRPTPRRPPRAPAARRAGPRWRCRSWRRSRRWPRGPCTPCSPTAPPPCSSSPPRTCRESPPPPRPPAAPAPRLRWRPRRPPRPRSART